jgi:recombination protein RecT
MSSAAATAITPVAVDGPGANLAPAKGTPLKQVRDLLAQSETQLAMALPKGIPASYLIRVVLTAVQRTPTLLECAPITLLGAVFQCAQLGLMPDGVLGEAYLVPFRNKKKNRMEVQCIPGYRGLVTLVRRSGELSTVSSEVVHKKDKFSFTFGTMPSIEHIPTDDPDPGPMTHVYAAARLKDGGYQIVVMNARQVNAIKARSAAVQAKRTSPWDTDPEWMWKKTALKQLTKLLPVSTQTQRAQALDDRAEIGLPQDLALLADESETPTVEDGEGSGDAPRTEEEQIAAELSCTPAEATAVLAGFLANGTNQANRQVLLKKYQGRADHLLQLLRDMSGQPLPVAAPAADGDLSTGTAATSPATEASAPQPPAESPRPQPVSSAPRPVSGFSI